ncbi:hypothetical protein BH09BAC5_BH09BAC5_14560 [soil metagenome]
MNIVFGHEELEVLFLTPLFEIKGKQKFPIEVLKQYKKKVQILSALTRLEQLKQHKG